MKIPKIENAGFIGLIIIGMFTFFYLILGVSGMMAAIGIILLFVLPFYLILDNSQLEQDEKIIFSFFIGVGVFSSITYWIGMFISFRVAIFITFAILVIVGYLVGRFRKK